MHSDKGLDTYKIRHYKKKKTSGNVKYKNGFRIQKWRYNTKIDSKMWPKVWHKKLGRLQICKIPKKLVYKMQNSF